jgi:CRP-like cAMP-binding protein
MINQEEFDCKKCIEDGSTIFGALTLQQKEKLLSSHTCTTLKKNEIIYEEGDHPNGLICLVEGKVKIYKEGIGGREQIVRMAQPNGFIGYRALFANETYNSSAATIEASTICIIDKENLFEVLKENCLFSLQIIKSLATELGFSNTRTVSLTQKHIRGRLAESLLVLRDTYGTDEEGNLNILLSREDIANLSNMTTSNAIRTLSSLSAEKIIALDGRKIKILDITKLERISRLG